MKCSLENIICFKSCSKLVHTIQKIIILQNNVNGIGILYFNWLGKEF